VAIDFGKFKETLPYSSELFGIYQPLLGWKSRRSLHLLQKEKHSLLEGALAEMIKAAPSRKALEEAPRPVGPDDLLPPDLPAALRTKAALSFREEAIKLQRERNGTLTDEDWKLIARNARLPRVLEEAARASKASRSERGPAMARSLVQEAVAAGMLAHLANHAPQTLASLLRTKKDLVARLRGAVDPLANFDPRTSQAVLSPIGLVHIFREYFFEFASFLGPAVEHVWVSPGGSLELFEVHTRRTVEERQVETATESKTYSESEVVEEDELSTAISEQNSRNTSFGVSASVSGSLFGIVEASASASFSMGFNNQTSQESAHRHARQQSEKLSNEIRRNFKTIFKTTVETEDSTSRRYVLQNVTDKLVNYELRRKMRQVGVQVQHIGTQLCWQFYVDGPGMTLGVAELVHAAQPADFQTTVPPPEAPPALSAKKDQYVFTFDFEPLDEEAADDGGDEEYHQGVDIAEAPEGKIRWFKDISVNSPATGYKLKSAAVISADRVDPEEDAPNPVATKCDVNADGESFRIFLNKVNFQDQPSIRFTVDLIWDPPQIDAATEQEYKKKMETYTEETQKAAHAAYVKAMRERIKLASNVRPRPAQDLRTEERSVIFRRLLHELTGIEQLEDEPHLTAELIRSIFDVEKMLYFVAEEWWRPRKHVSQQFGTTKTLTKEDMVGWGGTGGAWKLLRPNYMITEESEPARMGASLGWLLQLDGDTHRNAFLNSPWVKAVLPIRPGRELAALNWLKLAHVEGTEDLDARYGGTVAGNPNPTIEDAIEDMAREIQEQGTEIENVLKTETVFEKGFDPLEGGFRVTESSFELFDQWTEVLPTDQVVAVEYPQPAISTGQNGGPA
jgi:hypothetical protein